VTSGSRHFVQLSPSAGSHSGSRTWPLRPTTSDLAPGHKVVSETESGAPEGATWIRIEARDAQAALEASGVEGVVTRSSRAVSRGRMSVRYVPLSGVQRNVMSG